MATSMEHCQQVRREALARVSMVAWMHSLSFISRVKTTKTKRQTQLREAIQATTPTLACVSPLIESRCFVLMPSSFLWSALATQQNTSCSALLFRFCRGFAPVQNKFSALMLSPVLTIFAPRHGTLKIQSELWCLREEVSKPIP